MHQLSPPSSRLGLVGLWVADFGHNLGLEVLQLQYDFSGRAAQLQAVKVTGDECVPAGQVSWHCAAAALPIPWCAADQQLVRWLQEREWWEEEEEEEEEGFSGSASGSASLASTAAAAAGVPAAGVGQASRRPNSVVAIHKGSGQVAGPGFVQPEWVAGRLLVFQDGRLCFAWEGLEHVTDMRRLRLRQ